MTFIMALIMICTYLYYYAELFGIVSTDLFNKEDEGVVMFMSLLTCLVISTTISTFVAFVIFAGTIYYRSNKDKFHNK